MHDFKNFPELTNAQMPYYYWESPHKQIFDPFIAQVIRVHDGDTIIVRCAFRDFDFPVRLCNASARELKEDEKRDTSAQLSAEGKDAQKWLEWRILGQEVEITPTFSRVEKWGRLLASVTFKGVNIGLEEFVAGQVVPWERREDGKIPSFAQKTTLKEVSI